MHAYKNDATKIMMKFSSGRLLSCLQWQQESFVFARWVVVLCTFLHIVNNFVLMIQALQVKYLSSLYLLYLQGP